MVYLRVILISFFVLNWSQSSSWPSGTKACNSLFSSSFSWIDVRPYPIAVPVHLFLTTLRVYVFVSCSWRSASFLRDISGISNIAPPIGLSMVDPRRIASIGLLEPSAFGKGIISGYLTEMVALL